MTVKKILLSHNTNYIKNKLLELNMIESMFIFAFVSMFTIVNPFSTASVFMTITQGFDKQQKKHIAMRAAIIAFITLALFAFIGKGILTFFSISIEGFRLAGGVLLAGLGLRMINQKRKRIHSEEEREELMEKEDLSIMPLAIPFISGPGAIATVMLLIHDSATITSVVAVLGAILLVCVIAGVAMIESQYLERALGKTGNKVLAKIMGLIVLVIGIQFLINGVHNLLLQWGLILL